MYNAAAVSNPVTSLLHSLAALGPLISAERARFDSKRRITDDVFAGLADAGLFRLWLPKALGGPELSPHEFMIVVEAAARLDGSVGWLVGNGGAMSRAGGYLPEPVVRSWFAEKGTYLAAATGAVGKAVAMDGGYRVTGRWPFGSGSHHATHFMGLASEEGPDGQGLPPICCYFGKASVLVHDNWHVSGLRGTASNDFEVRDVFVPSDHCHPMTGMVPTQAGRLYRMPAISMFAWSVSVVPLGIALGAIDAFTNIASRKGRTGAPTMLRERETAQAATGRAFALYRSAHELLRSTMSDLISAEAGNPQTERAMLRAACTHAAESAVRIVDMLAEEAGAIAISEAYPIERAVRDVRAAIKHIAMSPGNYVVAGRLALGLDPLSQRF